MNDTELILSFLDKHCEVQTTYGDFGVIFKTEGDRSYFNVNNFIDVFGDFMIYESDRITSVTIYLTWIKNKKELIENRLTKYFDSTVLDDEGLGLEGVLSDAILYFKADEYISDYFISSWFRKYTLEKYVKPKLKNRLKNIVFTYDYDETESSLKKEFANFKDHVSFVVESYIDEYKTRFLIPKLDEFLENMDLTQPMLTLSNEIQEFKLINPRFTGLIASRFNSYYHTNHVIPLVEGYLAKFDVGNMSSQEFIDDIITTFHFEGIATKELVEEYINKWYANAKTINVINDFLSQLVMVSNYSGWVVKWVGHGIVKSDTIKNLIKNETAYQYRFSQGLYEEWYEDKVIKMSGKLDVSMSFNHGSVLPTLATDTEKIMFNDVYSDES